MILHPRYELIPYWAVPLRFRATATRVLLAAEARLGLAPLPVTWVRHVLAWWLRPWRRWLTKPPTPRHLRASLRFPPAFLHETRAVRLRFAGVFVPGAPDRIYLECPSQDMPATHLLLATVVAHEARHAWQQRQGWEGSRSTEAREADADRFTFGEMAPVIYAEQHAPVPRRKGAI